MAKQNSAKLNYTKLTMVILSYVKLIMAKIN